MKYLKTYEQKTTIIQQPFFLTKGDNLYLSDDFTKKIAPSPSEVKNYCKNVSYAEHIIQQNEYFFSGERNEKGYRISTRLDPNIHVSYNNMHKMTIVIFTGNNYDNESGKFYYYIGGHSGDYDMHGKSMVRATRECNLNFMAKFYPIILHIKDFYKNFKNGELFFDIIKSEILKNPDIVQYGFPDDLKNDEEVGYYGSAFKYNL